MFLRCSVNTEQIFLLEIGTDSDTHRHRSRMDIDWRHRHHGQTDQTYIADRQTTDRSLTTNYRHMETRRCRDFKFGFNLDQTKPIRNINCFLMWHQHILVPSQRFLYYVSPHTQFSSWQKQWREEKVYFSLKFQGIQKYGGWGRGWLVYHMESMAVSQRVTGAHAELIFPFEFALEHGPWHGTAHIEGTSFCLNPPYLEEPFCTWPESNLMVASHSIRLAITCPSLMTLTVGW